MPNPRSEGWAHNAILYKGLGHPWVLESMEILEPTPCRWEGWLCVFLSWASMITNRVFWPMMRCSEFRYIVECGCTDAHFYPAISSLLLPDYKVEVLWEQNKENVGKNPQQMTSPYFIRENIHGKMAYLLNVFSLKLQSEVSPSQGHYESVYFSFLKIRWFLLILVLAVLGLHCCAWAFSSCGELGSSLAALCGLLNAVASLAAERGL